MQQKIEFKVNEHLLFSTPLWECPVEGIDNSQILKYCQQVRQDKPGVQISNRGGWHSGELIQPLPESLINLLNNIQEFANDLCARHTGIQDLEMGNFWININGPGDFNMPHDHQRSILSGVYYVSVPSDNMGELVLHRGDNAEFFLTSRVKRENTLANIREIKRPAVESLFYLFPSWVKHHVEPNLSDKERVSIAFNLVSPTQK